MLEKIYHRIFKWIKKNIIFYRKDNKPLNSLNDNITDTQSRPTEINIQLINNIEGEISTTEHYPDTDHSESKSDAESHPDNNLIEKQTVQTGTVGSIQDLESTKEEAETEEIEVEPTNKDDIEVPIKKGESKGGIKTPRKPYIKKTPDEKSDPSIENTEIKPKTKEVINLGNKQRWKRRHKQNFIDDKDRDDKLKSDIEVHKNDKAI